MTAIAVPFRRVRRLVQIFGEVYRQTGSFGSALTYTYRYAASKLPRLLRRLWMMGRPRVGALAHRVATPAGFLAGTPKIAVKIGGGLGDSIVYARFLRDLAANCGPLMFDIYASTPEIARWVFASVPGVHVCKDDILFDYAWKDYDIALQCNQMAVVNPTAATSNILKQNSRLSIIVEQIERAGRKLKPFFERQPYWDNFLAQTMVYANAKRVNALHGMAGLNYGGDVFDIEVHNSAANRLQLAPRSYITVHNGFDPNFFVQNRRATKCYPHFAEVVQQIKQFRPDIQFVQIGTGTSEPIDGIDHNLIGKTTLKESAGLIGKARLHIDNEGGLVHLARCLDITSCVVFGPTPSNYFAYDGNINIDPAFCGGCWWITETWMDRCPRGFETPRCLSEQPPAVVAAAILDYLRAAPLPA